MNEVFNNIKLTNKYIIMLISLIPLLLSLFGFIGNGIFFIYLILISGYIFYKAKNRDIDTIKTLIYIIMFQNLFLVVFSKVMTSTQVSLYLLVKEILVILVVGYSFIKEKRSINLIDIFVLVFLSIIGYSFIVTDAAIMAKLANMRQLIIPILLFYFGTVIKIKKNDKEKIFRIIINLGKIIFLVGIIQFIIGERFFDIIKVYDFYAKKGLEGWISNGKYPVSFVAWDLHQIFNVYILRFISIFFEALTTGHIMALCFIIISFNKQFRHNKVEFWTWSSLFLLGTILTFSKGAYLIILIAFLYLLFTTIKNKKVIYTVIGIGLTSIIGVLYIIWDKVLSIQAHFNGFWHNIVSANLFSGSGLGNVGVYANAFSESNNSKGESLIGNLIGQFGILMGIIFIIIIFLIIYLNIKSKDENKGIALVLMIGVFIEMFLSESSVAFLSTGLYFVISGLYADINEINIFKLR